MSENNLALDLAIGRSSVRQRILALLMDEPHGRLHLREIQRRAGTSPGTASRELAKLVAAGLIDREAEGNQVYFRASTSPFATMFRSVLAAMPAPQVQPRPPRLPRAKSAAPAAKTEEPAVPDTAPVAPEVAPEGPVVAGTASPAPAAPVEAPADTEAAVADSAAPSTAPAPVDAVPEAAPVEEPVRTSPPPRVIRTVKAAPVAKPDPLGLRVAGRLAESIREIYGESLRGVYLYGSRAAGAAPADADVEAIVVLDRVDHYGAELERTSHICAALSHEMDLVVSRIFVAEPDWNGGPDGATPALRAEAVAV